MADAFSISLFALQTLKVVSSRSITQSNIRHLYADIFWFGILVGSLSGPILGEVLGVQPALLVGSGLRLLAGVLLLLV